MIWAMAGRTPATPCPAMMAWMYSPLPNPDANANAPFWISPVARLVVKTMVSTKPKYTAAETWRK